MKYTATHDNDFTAHGWGGGRHRPHHVAVVRGGNIAGAEASKVLRRPGRRKLARASLREYRYKRLELAQLLGQLGVFLSLDAPLRVGGHRRARIDAAVLVDGPQVGHVVLAGQRGAA
jgi:hypothetical protein